MSPVSNEEVWSGKFGDDYTERNKDAYKKRWPFWQDFVKRWAFDNCLEVGCNTAANLGMISTLKENQIGMWGCDVNANALWKARKLEPGLNLVYASGLNLPFMDDWFDLVFTAGVLIHQTPETREAMMQEIIRVSNGYVVAIEYDNPIFEEIPYRGLTNGLFKGPWGEVYEKRYGLRFLDKYEANKDVGFDRCTVYVLSKR